MSTPITDTATYRADAGRIAAVAAGHLDAEVPACPGWAVRDLLVHLGSVHRWAGEVLRTGESPGRMPGEGGADPAPDDDGRLLDWFTGGALELADALDAMDPGAPSWLPWVLERPVAGVWLRRMTQETSVHRWDAESAVGEPGPIAAPLAADGVDEYFTLIVPRRVARDGIDLPSGSLHVHCTDDDLEGVNGEWFVTAADGYAVTPEHRKGDAVLRGRAEDLLLALWGRPVPEGGVEVVGDPEIAAAWLAVGGS
ncbi:MAG: maleylpyruvate isomerase family mycothiol-dependent enzyme [Microthrixaceae bacterium]